MSALRHLPGRLADLARRDLLRAARAELPGDCLVLCSNDYLGFAHEPVEPAQRHDLGAGASRLISGDHAAHREAEQALAQWLDLEASLLFSSGYAANVGTLAALGEPGDLIVSDALNHASIVDGCRLSRAEVVVTPHLDLAAAQRALAAHPGGRRWVVIESYFSMDGNGPELDRWRALCDQHDAALVVDEAHALGVFGPRGRGLCAASGVVPDVYIGTLGKAVGLMGAFVAGSEVLRSWLWNRARSFVFSTGVSPWLAAAVAPRIASVAAADDRRQRLEQLAGRARAYFAEHGPVIAPSRGPILPWHVGDNAQVLALRDALLQRGVFVQAIRPPTVPSTQARLRITLHAQLSDDDVTRALEAIREVAATAREVSGRSRGDDGA
jgi:8-amino-7-oxononanoate synthase